ncbi:AAA family ATPase [uncultured Alsobacter sp.]|uniref:AAA family ATPase n=1 Tax=uncultured Alsobacter sp. TaxID=1748258 RepID=UPI0025E09028|nr:AAA family ATPase [uncultured Alsobacter sp.]
MAVLPPWLDASQAAKSAAARWSVDKRGWPSGEIAQSLRDAATSTRGVPSTVDAVAAALPHADDRTDRERMQKLLVEGLVAQAWLDPRGDGAPMAMLAACSTARCSGDEDYLHLAAAAFAYTVVGLRHCARPLAHSRSLAAICKRSASSMDQLKAAWRGCWRLLGSAGREIQRRRANKRKPLLVEGPVHGPDIATAALNGSTSAALETWRDEALAALRDPAAPPEVITALTSIDSWGPTIRRTLAKAGDAIEANAYDPRCRSEPVLTIRRDLVFWTALAGDAEAARSAAYLCACFASDGTEAFTQRVRAIGQLVALLRIAAPGSPLAHLSSDDATAPPRYTALAGDGAVRMVGETMDRFIAAISKAAWTEPTAGEATLEAIWSRAEAIPASARDIRLVEAKAEPSSSDTADSLVVIPRLPTGRSGNSRDVDHDWRPLVGRALPLVPVPELQRARDEILARVPHCAEIVDRILGDLAGRRTIHLRPTLFVGPPGCGKSTLARLILDNLGLPHIIYPAAGIADSSVAGTSKQWSTGRASVALQQVRSSGIANPAVVVDEIDKAARHPANGRLEDGLLPLLEPTTASRAFDYLLETEVDLSAISWIATANTVEELSAPVRDRFQVLRVPDPEPHHLGVLLPTVIADILRERGLRPEWVEPLAGDEIDLVANAWKPRSLRRLAKVMQIVLRRRDALAARH